MGPLDLEVGLGQFWGGGPHWGFSIPCSPFLPPPSSIHNLLCNKVLVPLLQYFSTLQCLHAIAFLLSESSSFKHKFSRQIERVISGQEAIRVSICLSHQLKEAEDRLATQTLCPSANARSKDTKRKLESFHKFVQTSS